MMQAQYCESVRPYLTKQECDAIANNIVNHLPQKKEKWAIHVYSNNLQQEWYFNILYNDQKELMILRNLSSSEKPYVLFLDDKSVPFAIGEDPFDLLISQLIKDKIEIESTISKLMDL